MKLSKKKVFALALAVCLLATLSLGSLAWFTDQDSVTNDFMIAGSEDGDKDDIFSVDVLEDGDEEDDGLVYEDILPGDTLSKVAHVKNTGSYEQYIRVKITVSQASIWQDVYDANMVPVTEFVNVDLSKVYKGKVGSYLDEVNDSFVYYLYYNAPLTLDDPATTAVDESDMIVFTEAYIDEELTREQAAAMKGGFQVTVTADAVQTENVGDNVYEAFKTVGMEIEVNTVWVNNKAELIAAFENDGYIVLNADIKHDDQQTVSATVNLYLNNHTLRATRKTNDTSWTLTGDLTIGGHGTLVLPGDYGIYVNGALSIFGGTYLDDYDRSCEDEALFNVYEKGVLNIYNGTFTGQEYCVNVRNGNGVANIYGGSFTAKIEGIKY